MKYLTNRIKKDIQKGGIVIAPRRAGKTTAIIELLEQSKTNEYLLICFSENCAKQIRGEMITRGIKNGKEINSCVVGPRNAMTASFNKIIIDEFFWNPAFYNSSFLKYHCIVSSTPKNLYVYNKKGRKLTTKEEDIFDPENKH